MIAPLKDVKALLRKYSGVRELLAIPAQDWNHMVDVLIQNRPLVIGAGNPSGWVHPWEIATRWDAERGALRYRINPGFVNGRTPVMAMDAKLAPAEYVKEEGRVRVPLTESPEALIRPDAWRPIGSDATAIGSKSTGDFSASLTFEPVPEFFRAFGVTEANPVDLSLVGGLQELLNDAEGEREMVRLLRAVEVILTQPRPAARALVEPSNGLGGTFAAVNVTYALPGDETPTIGTRQKFDPSPPPDEAGILSGSYKEEPWDELHLATIYALSPRGLAPGAEVSADWSFYVRHREFWNLNHATNRIPPAVPQAPLQFPFPLAGGVGTLAINTALAVVNDNSAAALALIQGARIEGRFWTI